jgi:hypothetical protein
MDRCVKRFTTAVNGQQFLPLLNRGSPRKGERGDERIWDRNLWSCLKSIRREETAQNKMPRDSDTVSQLFYGVRSKQHA